MEGYTDYEYDKCRGIIYFIGLLKRKKCLSFWFSNFFMVLLLKKKKNGTYWFEETTYKKNRIRGEIVIYKIILPLLAFVLILLLSLWVLFEISFYYS